MKTKNVISVIILVLILKSGISAQNIIYYENDSIIKPQYETSQLQNQTKPIKEKSKISYSIDIGTSFSASKNFGNMLAFYTSPQIKYRLSPKLDITAGAFLINSTSNIPNVSENVKSNYNKAYITAGLDYTKERLRISGQILYGLNKSPYDPFTNKKSPEYFVRFNAEYKITPSFSIGLQVINQKMEQGSYFSPYGYGFNNPYNVYNPFYNY